MENIGNANVEFKTERDKFGRMVQTMYLLDDDGKHTRDAYFTTEMALEQLRDNFDFRSGKVYTIAYLTGYQWKSARQFTYIPRRTDLKEHVYGMDQELENYGDQAIDDGDLHIYAIAVHQL